MPRPHEIVRRKDLYSFIPYGKTQLDELIRSRTFKDGEIVARRPRRRHHHGVHC